MITLTYFELLMLVFVSVLATAWFGWWHWRKSTDDGFWNGYWDASTTGSPLAGIRLLDGATRQDRIDALRYFYLACCVEDLQNGTQFDCYVFDFFDKAEEEFGD